MTRTLPRFGATTTAVMFAGVLVVLARAQATPQQPAAAPAAPQQPNEISTTISGEPGAVPRFAVPDFIALPAADGRPADAETRDAAQTIGRVLFDDLSFEREFA